MRKSTYGSSGDAEGIMVVMDAMLAAGIQVVSVVSVGDKLYAFGIAEDDLQINQAFNETKRKSMVRGYRHQASVKL